MPPRDWKREVEPGNGILRTNRTKQVNIRIRADLERLWKAEKRHHRMPQNAIIAWALSLLELKNGEANPDRLDLAHGMRRPDNIVSCTTMVSETEDKLWQRLAVRHQCARKEIVRLALLELYWHEPVDLQAVMLRDSRRHARPPTAHDAESAEGSSQRRQAGSPDARGYR